jgi:TolA-binding protein
MRIGLKIGAYVVLIACAVWLASGFFKYYSASGEPARIASTNQAVPPFTNAPAEGGLEANGSNSNGPNSTPADPTSDDLASPPPLTAAPPAARQSGKIIGYFGALIGVLALLGLLVGRDVSHYLGNRALEVIYNDDGEGQKNPEYEQAEQAWANGEPLEAIQLMRDYLKKHPREQYVALRIAEIYENDLKNFLAAALEYEEVLKHRLPDERWGWAAIHLANLYSGRLGKQDQAVELLRRIVSEYGHTSAARKARERLEKLDPKFLEAQAAADAEETTMDEPSAPPSNLPPGFRPKTAIRRPKK